VPRRRRRATAPSVAAPCIAVLGWAAPAVARPSVLLAVLDTVRVDAVSAYGQIDGTTPTLDRPSPPSRSPRPNEAADSGQLHDLEAVPWASSASAPSGSARSAT